MSPTYSINGLVSSALYATRLLFKGRRGSVELRRLELSLGHARLASTCRSDNSQHGLSFCCSTMATLTRLCGQMAELTATAKRSRRRAADFFIAHGRPSTIDATREARCSPVLAAHDGECFTREREEEEPQLPRRVGFGGS